MTLPRRSILIFHQAALGDFVTTWPLAMALGRVFAQSRVMYITGPDKGRLAEAAIGVEWLAADDGWHALHGEADPPEAVVKKLQAAQCVVLFAEGDEPVLVGNIARFAGDVPLIQIRPKPPAGVHVLDHQVAQLDGQGKLKGYVEQMQNLLRTSGLGSRPGVSDGDVLIHPGSGSPAKNWPLASFVEVARGVAAAGKRVAFLIGEVERERFSPADLATLRATGPVIEPPDLPALRTTLAGASAFLGNDSGPTHLAAAMGLPTAALFGPASSPEQWRPTGPRVEVATFDVEPADVVKRLLGRPAS